MSDSWQKIRVLLIEDSVDDAELLIRTLKKGNFEACVEQITTAREMARALEEKTWDIILSDYNVPGFGAMIALDILKKSRIDIPFIVVSGAVGEETAVEVMRLGASDFIMKNNLSRLNPVIRRELGDMETRRARVRAEEALHSSEERYEIANKSAEVGVWEIDIKNDKIICSDMTAKLFGIIDKKLKFEELRPHIHPGDWPQLLRALEEEAKQSEGYSIEFRVPLENGEFRWLTSRGRQITNHYERTQTIFGVNMDITELKAAQTAAQEAREAADRASHAKSEFLAKMSHEIRTPLNIILGFSELSADPDVSPEDRAEYFSRIKRSGQHLLSLIDDILDLSRVEAGHIKIEKTKFSIASMVDEILVSLLLPLDKKRIETRIEFVNPIPAEIESDKVRLQQILTNLIGNAVKFTDHGQIIVRFGFKGEDLTIEVEDSGIGIHPEFHSRLFQPFMQIDNSPTRKFGGAGLGLELSRRIIRRLGGDLGLKWSAPNHGSCFWMRVPAGRGRSQEMISELDPSSKETLSETFQMPASGHLQGARILLVEDSKDNEVLIMRYLAKEGVDIEVARNGLEAIEKARTQDFDVILMDVQMPILDGLEATRRLRARGYKKPIIALTAHALTSERENSRLAGCDAHMSKPVIRSQLISTLQEFIPFSRASKAANAHSPEKTL